MADDDSPVTQLISNMTPAETLEELGLTPDQLEQLFPDLGGPIPPVDPTVPTIGDFPAVGVGSSLSQQQQDQQADLIQQALQQANVNVPAANVGVGTSDQQRQPTPSTSGTDRGRRRGRGRGASRGTARGAARGRQPTATVTSNTQLPTGTIPRRRTASESGATRQAAPANRRAQVNLPNQGRMQQQLRLLLDDIAADDREISNIVTTNTVTTTYKQNRRRPTVTQTRTRVGNNRRNRPSVQRTSTRVTGPT